MKLDPTVMRTMNRQDFRVLAAVESGMKNHSLVPMALINSIANLRHGGTNKIISSLLRDKLLSHDQSCGYDGYRLTNSGYDILALHDLKSRGIIAGIGDKIGTGKESDVYLAVTPRNTQIVLKFHRLGRTSFRDVKKKRDYFMVNAMSKSRKGGGVRYRNLPNSWLFLSRTSALKEYAFMKALYDVDYPTPRPVGQNRHIVAMGLVRGVPLYQLHSNRVSAAQAQSIFEQSAILTGRLAAHGLVHCDMNEFNLIVDLSGVQSKIASTGGDDDDDFDDELTMDGTVKKKDWEDDATEHYVRHSGLAVPNKGELSSHSALQKHTMDGTGEVVTEAPPEPAEHLENGEPKPIVTLIDFPQMVSTRHPNAQELYERDVVCLKKFFGKKLKCYVDGETDLAGIMPSWEELIANADGEQQIGMPTDAADDASLMSKDFSLVSKAQLRLDDELKASGYSEEDAARDAEFAYYEAHQNINRDLNDVDEEEEDESDDDEDGDEHGGASHDDGYKTVESELNDDPVAGDDNDDPAACGDGNGEEEAPDLIDMDEFHAQKSRGGGDALSISGMSRISGVSRLSHADAEKLARERVRRHMEDRKRAGQKKGAFRTRNNNKSYSKGKRVLNDFGL